MGIAKTDPFDAEFAARSQQRQKSGGKSIGSTGRPGTHHQIGGNIGNTDGLGLVFIGLAGENVIQHGRIGIFSGSHKIFILFLSHSQRGAVFFRCFLDSHSKPPLILIVKMIHLYHIHFLTILQLKMGFGEGQISALG